MPQDILTLGLQGLSMLLWGGTAAVLGAGIYNLFQPFVTEVSEESGGGV